MPEPTNPNAGAATADTGADKTTPPAAAPAVDVQAEVQRALAAQQAEFAKQLKAATGHDDIKSLTDAQLKEQGKLQELADNKSKEAATYKQQFQQVNITNALLSASAEAVDAGTVSALLASKAVCDDNGVVTVDGKPVAEAVKQLLAEKPFLAKAQGGTGSGAPGQADLAGGSKNPWSDKHFNLTEQSRITLQDPVLADKLKAAAVA